MIWIVYLTLLCPNGMVISYNHTLPSKDMADEAADEAAKGHDVFLTGCTPISVKVESL